MNLFGLSIGTENTKLGSVYSFSLPSKETCPGASLWCQKKCYAARYERLRAQCREAYRRNLELARDSKRFEEIMKGALPRLLSCFRIHVAGDYFDEKYLHSWIAVCREFPRVSFWCYTKSWNVDSLLLPLHELNTLPNATVFLSCDPTMPLPPQGWRAAFIEGDPRARGTLCLEQTGHAGCCLDCGYCFVEKRGDVIFRVR